MDADAVPQSLGPYKIECMLGKGGFATVYRATAPDSGRPVALKILHPKFAQNTQIVRSLEREVRRLVGLAHENLVSVIGFEVLDGRHAMVMEYIQGPTLTWSLYPDQEDEQSDLTQFYGDAADGTILATAPATRAHSQPPTIAESVSIILGVASALEYVHGLGIYHLDIKPDNVLISRDRALLTDFGIAQALEDESSDLRGAGTPAYSSPEQARGVLPDARSDIYSLGIVLYEMLARQVPFTGETTRAVLEQHQTATPVLPSKLRADVPRGLESVLMRCLEKSPDKRYQTATDLKEALRGIVRDGTRPARLYDLWCDKTGGEADTKCALCGGKFARRWLEEECPHCSVRRASGICPTCGLVWQTAHAGVPCPVCDWIWNPEIAESESRRLLDEAEAFVALQAEEAGHTDILRAYVFRRDLLPNLDEKAHTARLRSDTVLHQGSVVAPGRGDFSSQPGVLSALKDLLGLVHLWESEALDRFIASQDLEVLRRRRVAELTARAERLRGLYFSMQASAASTPKDARSGYEMAKRWHLQSARSFELAKAPEAAAAVLSGRLAERVVAFADEPTSAESRESWPCLEGVAQSDIPGVTKDVQTWDDYNGMYGRFLDVIESARGCAEEALVHAKNTLVSRNEKLVSLRDLARREVERAEQGCTAAAIAYRADLGRLGRLSSICRFTVFLGPLLLTAITAGLVASSATSALEWLSALAAAPMLCLPAAWAYLRQRRAQPLATRKVDTVPMLAGLVSSWLVLIVVMTFFGIPRDTTFLTTERQILINGGLGWGVLAAAWFLESRLGKTKERGCLSRLYQGIVYSATLMLLIAYGVAIASWLPLAPWWLATGALSTLLLGSWGGRSMAAIASAEAIARERQFTTLTTLERTCTNTLDKISNDQRNTVEDTQTKVKAFLSEAEVARGSLEGAARQLSAHLLGRSAETHLHAATLLRDSMSVLADQSANPDDQVLGDLETYVRRASQTTSSARSAAENDYREAPTSTARPRARVLLLAGSALMMLVILVWGGLGMVTVTPSSDAAAIIQPGLQRIQSQPHVAKIRQVPQLASGTPAPVQTVRAILADRPTEPTTTPYVGATATLKPSRDGGIASLPILATVKAVPAVVRTAWVREVPSAVQDVKQKLGLGAAPISAPVPAPDFSAHAGNVPSVTPKVTPMSEVTANPAAAAAGKAQVEVVVNKANVRQGPGTNYKITGGATKGTKFDLVGCSAPSGWWLVCCVKGQNVWIANSVVRVTGSPNQVPVVTPAVRP